MIYQAWSIVIGCFMAAWGIFYSLLDSLTPDGHGSIWFVGTMLSLLAIHKFLDIFVSNFIGAGSYSSDDFKAKVSSEGTKGFRSAGVNIKKVKK